MEIVRFIFSFLSRVDILGLVELTPVSVKLIPKTGKPTQFILTKQEGIWPLTCHFFFFHEECFAPHLCPE